MSERILMKFIVGQRVVKEGEDSRFEGQVVACFVKRDLKTIRYVVEDDGGVLRVASERQLLLAMPKSPERLELSHSGACRNPQAGSILSTRLVAQSTSQGRPARATRASNIKLDIIVATRIRAPQRQPPGVPHARASLIRVPVIGRPINRQAHQLQRHLRRSAFDRFRSPRRLERRGSSAG